MFKGFRKAMRGKKLSMRMKLTLSLSAIVVILLVSSTISTMEYDRMSNYVTDLIDRNIRSVDLAQRMADSANAYNLSILAAIGDSVLSKVPVCDETRFLSDCDSLRVVLGERGMSHLADSVELAFGAYMLTSKELTSVFSSPQSSRVWYFDSLQPAYDKLRSSMDEVSDDVYSELRKNSATFQRGYYRSLVPGIVSVIVGILLVCMLLFFILVYYVNPLYRMLSGLDNYKAVGKKYNVTFEGDDQLRELSDGIADVTEENSQLRRRLKNLRQSISQQNPQ